ncbi:MAG: hypothetical protein LC623_07005 [Halobacteriales archaeon]|nr:hypothetical protein [Halobacteriales archaeon]
MPKWQKVGIIVGAVLVLAIIGTAIGGGKKADPSSITVTVSYDSKVAQTAYVSPLFLVGKGQNEFLPCLRDFTLPAGGTHTQTCSGKTPEKSMDGTYYATLKVGWSRAADDLNYTGESATYKITDLPASGILRFTATINVDGTVSLVRV